MGAAPASEHEQAPGRDAPGGLWWRWGESNPRPTGVQQDFSGCSSLVIFSAPAPHASKGADGLSR